MEKNRREKQDVKKREKKERNRGRKEENIKCDELRAAKLLLC